MDLLECADIVEPDAGGLRRQRAGLLGRADGAPNARPPERRHGGARLLAGVVVVGADADRPGRGRLPAAAGLGVGVAQLHRPLLRLRLLRRRRRASRRRPRRRHVIAALTSLTPTNKLSSQFR